MKIFIKTITVGNYYNYCVYRITDFNGQTYYVAEPILHGVTRTALTEAELVKALEHDVVMMNHMRLHIK